MRSQAISSHTLLCPLDSSENQIVNTRAVSTVFVAATDKRLRRGELTAHRRQKKTSRLGQPFTLVVEIFSKRAGMRASRTPLSSARCTSACAYPQLPLALWPLSTLANVRCYKEGVDRSARFAVTFCFYLAELLLAGLTPLGTLFLL
ncbi:hypothetical protein RRG08_034370 [Elysia crispata]|uniref:Uncharacterized protein n=1 Tax=Elysia crispata TaxID=231223 RepID=A0AAE0YD25_9GAST|nr:hypothetical protein RRG08_034370 [Elysia crispata]